MDILCNSKYFISTSEKLRIALVAAMALLWTLFFYDNSIGLNLFIFGLCLMMVQGWYQSEVWQEGSNWLIGLLWLLSLMAVAWHGSDIAILSVFLWMLVATGRRFIPASSLLTALLNSIGSLATSFLYDVLVSRQQDPPGGKGFIAKLAKTIKLTIGPIAIIFFFFILYAFASDSFGNLSGDALNLISIGRLFYFGFAFAALYGLFHYLPLKSLTEEDLNAGNFLERIRHRRKRNSPMLALHNEYLRATFLFGGLNLLLLLFHGSDVYSLITTQDSLNHSAMVHQGVNTLIFSIIVAIILIVFHFRGNLNFYSKSKTLRQLVYGWIALNALLVLSTFFKNYLYIAQYGLTYKRVGVTFFLLLCLAGLLITLLKVTEKRNFWFLLRSNAWVFFVTGTLFAALPWNPIITQHNLDRKIGYAYVLKLGDNNTHLIARHLQENPYELRDCRLLDLWKHKLSRTLRKDHNLLESTWLQYQRDNYLQSIAIDPSISEVSCQP